MLRDEAKHVRLDLGTRDVGAARPRAIEHQLRDRVGMLCRPLGGDRGAQRCAEQFEAIGAGGFDHRTERLLRQFEGVFAAESTGESAAGKVVPDDRSVPCQRLVEAALRRCRPPEFEVTDPSRCTHEERSAPAQGEGDPGAVVKRRFRDPLIHEAHSTQRGRAGSAGKSPHCGARAGGSRCSRGRRQRVAEPRIHSPRMRSTTLPRL